MLVLSNRQGDTDFNRFFSSLSILCRRSSLSSRLFSLSTARDSWCCLYEDVSKLPTAVLLVKMLKKRKYVKVLIQLVLGVFILASHIWFYEGYKMCWCVHLSDLVSGTEGVELLRWWMADVGVWCLPGKIVPLQLILEKKNKKQLNTVCSSYFSLKQKRKKNATIFSQIFFTNHDLKTDTLNLNFWTV